MFRQEFESQRFSKNLFHTFILSFLAGNVNAGGFMACGRFVSHVTGFATLFGIDLARGDWKSAIGILSVPLYFLIGAMISAYFVDRRIHFGKKPLYPLVMLLMTALLISASVGGHFQFFGVFGKNRSFEQDYFLLALLCGASGLQNAAVTTSSGALIRTTHLTGLTTDLGVGIVRILFPKNKREIDRREIKINSLRAGTIFSFVAGSVVGAFLFLKIDYLGFILPALIAFYAFLVTIQTNKKL